MSEKDKGIYNAMNKGIKLSNGKYVAFLNSDDWLENDVLLKVSKFIEKENPSVVYGDAKFYKWYFSFYAKANLKKLKKYVIIAFKFLCSKGNNKKLFI